MHMFRFNKYKDFDDSIKKSLASSTLVYVYGPRNMFRDFLTYVPGVCLCQPPALLFSYVFIESLF